MANFLFSLKVKYFDGLIFRSRDNISIIGCDNDGVDLILERLSFGGRRGKYVHEYFGNGGLVAWFQYQIF